MQRGQAPWGELKEKIRGSSSGIEIPQCRHAKRSEKVSTRASPPSRGSVSISRIPSASATAVSTESASRLRASGFMISRSTTTEMSCLNFLSSTISLFEQADLAVDLDAGEALGAQLLELLAVLALAAAHDRRQDHEPRAVLQVHDLVDDLLGRLRRDRPAAVEAVRLADARPQQAQVVVDLRHGADRRARVARGRLLVDRDRGRQALDRVDVRLVHLPQELAGVGAQRLDVAALALGVDRVERERRLARAGQARDDHERVARHGDGDVLEVVLAGARDDDLLLPGHMSQCTESEDGIVERMFA